MSYPIAVTLTDIGDRFVVVAHRVPLGNYTDTWEPTISETDWEKLRRIDGVVTAQTRIDGKFVLLAKAGVVKPSRRERRPMTDDARERIIALYRSGQSYAQIGATVGYAKTTIERVISTYRANGLVDYRYAGCADARP